MKNPRAQIDQANEPDSHQKRLKNGSAVTTKVCRRFPFINKEDG
jgi:hypothetical protein